MKSNEEMINRLRKAGYQIEYVPMVRIPTEVLPDGRVMSYELKDIYEVYRRLYYYEEINEY